MRWCGSLLLAAACCAVPLTVRAGCVPLGGHFTTAAKCCPGLCYTKGAEFVTCQPCATTTTVVQTTSTTMVTTSTVAGQTTTSTTSTTIPSSGLPDLGLRFTPTDLAPTPSVPAGYASAPFPDPRTGLPATEFVKAVIGWQLMALAADTVNAADAAGCTVNQQQLEDALWKFGLNYVLLHTGGPQVHGSYAWLNPTYVRQYTLEPLLSAYPCIRAAGDGGCDARAAGRLRAGRADTGAGRAVDGPERRQARLYPGPLCAPDDGTMKRAGRRGGRAPRA